MVTFPPKYVSLQMSFFLEVFAPFCTHSHLVSYLRSWHMDGAHKEILKAILRNH